MCLPSHKPWGSQWVGLTERNPLPAVLRDAVCSGSEPFVSGGEGRECAAVGVIHGLGGPAAGICHVEKLSRIPGSIRSSQRMRRGESGCVTALNDARLGVQVNSGGCQMLNRT